MKFLKFSLLRNPKDNRDAKIYIPAKIVNWKTLKVELFHFEPLEKSGEMLMRILQKHTVSKMQLRFRKSNN